MTKRMESIPYQIIRSERRTISIQIKPSGQMIVRCPKRMTNHDIQLFVQSKSDWIEKHIAKVVPNESACFSKEEIDRLREQARKLITQRVKYFAPIIGVTYNTIAIRTQRTRWGSCSSKGNLNFNCLLALAPAEVLDYVVVHELCHRKELNHSHKFWDEVESILPNYKQQQKWLKEYGQKLIARV